MSLNVQVNLTSPRKTSAYVYFGGPAVIGGRGIDSAEFGATVTSNFDTVLSAVGLFDSELGVSYVLRSFQSVNLIAERITDNPMLILMGNGEQLLLPVSSDFSEIGALTAQSDTYVYATGDDYFVTGNHALLRRFEQIDLTAPRIVDNPMLVVLGGNGEGLILPIGSDFSVLGTAAIQSDSTITAAGFDAFESSVAVVGGTRLFVNLVRVLTPDAANIPIELRGPIRPAGIYSTEFGQYYLAGAPQYSTATGTEFFASGVPWAANTGRLVYPAGFNAFEFRALPIVSKNDSFVTPIGLTYTEFGATDARSLQQYVTPRDEPPSFYLEFGTAFASNFTRAIAPAGLDTLFGQTTVGTTRYLAPIIGHAAFLGNTTIAHRLMPTPLGFDSFLTGTAAVASNLQHIYPRANVAFTLFGQGKAEPLNRSITQYNSTHSVEFGIGRAFNSSRLVSPLSTKIDQYGVPQVRNRTAQIYTYSVEPSVMSAISGHTARNTGSAVQPTGIPSLQFGVTWVSNYSRSISATPVFQNYFGDASAYNAARLITVAGPDFTELSARDNKVINSLQLVQAFVTPPTFGIGSHTVGTSRTITIPAISDGAIGRATAGTTTTFAPQGISLSYVWPPAVRNVSFTQRIRIYDVPAIPVPGTPSVKNFGVIYAPSVVGGDASPATVQNRNRSVTPVGVLPTLALGVGSVELKNRTVFPLWETDARIGFATITKITPDLDDTAIQQFIEVVGIIPPMVQLTVATVTQMSVFPTGLSTAVFGEADVWSGVISPRPVFGSDETFGAEFFGVARVTTPSPQTIAPIGWSFLTDGPVIFFGDEEQPDDIPFTPQESLCHAVSPRVIYCDGRQDSWHAAPKFHDPNPLTWEIVDSSLWPQDHLGATQENLIGTGLTIRTTNDRINVRPTTFDTDFGLPFVDMAVRTISPIGIKAPGTPPPPTVTGLGQLITVLAEGIDIFTAPRPDVIRLPPLNVLKTIAVTNGIAGLQLGATDVTTFHRTLNLTGFTSLAFGVTVVPPRQAIECVPCFEWSEYGATQVAYRHRVLEMIGEDLSDVRGVSWGEEFAFGNRMRVTKGKYTVHVGGVDSGAVTSPNCYNLTQIVRPRSALLTHYTDVNTYRGDISEGHIVHYGN